MNSLRAYEDQSGERSFQSREAMITSHLSLVRFLVNSFTAQLPGHIDPQELASAAIVGLITAADRYDPSLGIQFRTFAEQRVRGAILDELRSYDTLTRTMRQRSKAIEKEMQNLEQQLGRNPSGVEMAQAMKISLDEYHQLLDDTREYNFLNLDDSWNDDEGNQMCLADVLGDDTSKSPHQQAEVSQLTVALGAAIEALPERERLAVTLYYYEELNLKEIGAVMKLTESRISQIISQAMGRLKIKLKQFKP